MSALAEQVSGASGTIGRYFTVVSSVPSLLFVTYVFLLVKSGAWSGPPDFSDVLGSDWVGDAVLLGVLSFAVALGLHPLQFALIRLFEGYWGGSHLGRDLASLRIWHHRGRRLALLREARKAQNIVERDPRGQDPRTIAAAVTVAESRREQAAYPAPEVMLPTRLGNVLRRTELTAGRAYNLDAIPVLPRIALVAPTRETDYLQDQRLQMELAVRTAFLGLLAALATVVLMLGNGWWVLLGLVPYGLAYLSYRGAVVVAASYSTAVAMLIELNRFTLYERFHLEHPADSTEERRTNIELMRALRHDPNSNLRYERPPPATS